MKIKLKALKSFDIGSEIFKDSIFTVYDRDVADRYIERGLAEEVKPKIKVKSKEKGEKDDVGK